MMAWDMNWYSVVIVSHSFELIKHRKQTRKAASVHRILVRRFDRLCRFLAGNRDRFQTAVFSEISTESIPRTEFSQPLHSGLHYTIHRYYEQALRRIM